MPDVEDGSKNLNVSVQGKTERLNISSTVESQFNLHLPHTLFATGLL